ncbi:MAG: diguanylate cyclase [Clostridia bacterium]|nr:diguanylate cyclase [Clostridia bacterium]
MSKWEKIKSTLNDTLYLLDDASKTELIQQISIYHEELYFQNQELMRINERLEIVKNNYQELFDFSPVCYFIINEKGLILDANKKASEWFGTVHETNIAQYIDSESQNDFYFFLREVYGHKENRSKIVFRSKGQALHFEIIGKPIVNTKNHFLIACLDLENEYQAMKKIKDLSFKDQLTGLYNRRYFEEEIHRINHPRMLPFSIIIGDVNGLKLVNDAFGHQAGDDLLRRAAQIMLNIDRGTDIIARIGGDEFAVLLPNTTEEDCKKILNRFHSSCSNLIIRDIGFSISFGSATMNDSTEDVEEVISNAEESMYRSKLLTESSKSAEIVNSILAALHEKHPREEFHSKRVSEYMKRMGEYYGFDKNHIEMMGAAGILHDIGKVAIDYSILDKSSSLSKEEIDEIRRHSEIGFRILKTSSVFSDIARIILHHHEWCNGNGYPKGLMGSEIPFEAKVLSICDAYDAMTSDRPYRKALTSENALVELESSAVDQFDQDIVSAFTDMIKK